MEAQALRFIGGVWVTHFVTHFECVRIVVLSLSVLFNKRNTQLDHLDVISPVAWQTLSGALDARAVAPDMWVCRSFLLVSFASYPRPRVRRESGLQEPRLRLWLW